MTRSLSKLFAAFAVMAMLMAPQSALADSMTSYQDQNVNPMFDLMFLRPAGLATLACGTVAMVVMVPVTLLVRPTELDVPFDSLMKRPFEYTFVDPLGSH
jgi:hypothetical protein